MQDADGKIKYITICLEIYWVHYLSEISSPKMKIQLPFLLALKEVHKAWGQTLNAVLDGKCYKETFFVGYFSPQM